jgi:hypothetical protein
MAKITFKVTGETKIHCASCEQRVDRALGITPPSRMASCRWAG